MLNPPFNIIKIVKK